MKKLITTVAIIATCASAKVYAETWVIQNRSGNGIYVTDRACHNKKYPNLKSGYAIAEGGQVLRFCWILMDGKVMAAYDDGSEYFYPATSFVKVQ